MSFRIAKRFYQSKIDPDSAMSPENGIRNSDSAMNFRIWEPKRDRTAVSSLNREQLLDATALIATLLAEDVRNAFTEPVKTSHSASFYTACAKFGTPNIIRAIQTLREIGSAMNFRGQRDKSYCKTVLC